MMIRTIGVCLLISSFLVACKEETKQNREEAEPTLVQDPATLDSIEAANQMANTLACLEEIELICELGLRIAPLGNPVLQLPATEIGEVELMDLVQETEDYVWFERTVKLAQGQVILEGDFIDARSPERESQLAASRLNRIRIESPSFKTQAGVKVGDPLTSLSEAYPVELLMTALPDFDMIDLQPVNSRLHFLLPISKTELADESFELPNDRAIKAIVVM